MSNLFFKSNLGILTIKKSATDVITICKITKLIANVLNCGDVSKLNKRWMFLAIKIIKRYFAQVKRLFIKKTEKYLKHKKIPEIRISPQSSSPRINTITSPIIKLHKTRLEEIV